MSDWRAEIEMAIDAFVQVAGLGGAQLARADIEIEFLPAPHRSPSRQPSGKTAVYGFWGDGCWLKIGRVGPHSNARYTNQHYNPLSSRSNLAASLLADPRMAAAEGFDPQAPGEWIRRSAHRVNILLSASHPPELPALLEAFLHLRLRPRHERKSAGAAYDPAAGTNT